MILALLLPAVAYALWRLGARLDAWEERHVRVIMARARARVRGMGQSPMVASSRAAYPLPQGTAQASAPEASFPRQSGLGCPVGALNAAPGCSRGAAPTPPSPHSPLEKPVFAAGAARLVATARL